VLEGLVIFLSFFPCPLFINTRAQVPHSLW